MKTSELLEQTYRRRSAEEIAAEKNAPDYWRKELRKEHSNLIKKFGGKPRNPQSFDKFDPRRATFNKDVLFFTEADEMLPADKRAIGYVKALAKLYHRLVQEGYSVHPGHIGNLKGFEVLPSDSVEEVYKKLYDEHSLDRHIAWWKRQDDHRKPLTIGFITVIIHPAANK